MGSLGRMLELFHDITSPASYVAVVRMQRLADEGLQVRFHGVDVAGLAATLPVPLAVLAELEHVRDEALAMGLALTRPRACPPTAPAHLVAAHAEQRDLGAAWRLATYRGFWERGLDLSDPAVIAELAASCGLDPDVAVAHATDRAALAAARRQWASLRGDGIGGVPVVRASGTLVPATLPDEDLRHLSTL